MRNFAGGYLYQKALGQAIYCARYKRQYASLNQLVGRTNRSYTLRLHFFETGKYGATVTKINRFFKIYWLVIDLKRVFLD